MKAGWTTKRLGEVCDVVNGGTPRTSVAEYWGGLHCWITPAEMGGDGSPYRDQTCRTLTDAGLHDSSASLVPAKSVILSSRAPIGHLVINLVPMATNQGCKSLVPKAEIEHKFLYYYLKSIVSLLESLGTGATFKELSGGKLKGVVISFPPLPEQRRIVALLDEAFAGLATAAANAERNLDNARELFESHLAEVFSRRGDGWVERRLAELAENMDSRRVPITKGQRKAGPYPYYGASGVVDHVADYIFDGDALLISEDGANLLARSTPIAFSVSGRYWVNNHAHVLCFDDLDTQRYVEYYFESISVAEFVRGAAQPKLTQKALNAILVPLPSSVGERKAIVAELDSVSAESQRLSRLYEQRQAALADLKRSLLHQAFSGNL